MSSMSSDADWTRRRAVEVHDETDTKFLAEYGGKNVFDSPFRYGRELIDRSWAHCVSQLPPQGKCLDIGCGVGAHMAQLLEQGRGDRHRTECRDASAGQDEGAGRVGRRRLGIAIIERHLKLRQGVGALPCGLRPPANPHRCRRRVRDATAWPLRLEIACAKAAAVASADSACARRRPAVTRRDHAAGSVSTLVMVDQRGRRFGAVRNDAAVHVVDHDFW